MFENSNFYLMSGSPCIDAGNSVVEQNDPEDPLNPGQAEFPSMGGLRNDMGAYGGPFSKILGDYITRIEELTEARSNEAEFFIYPNPVAGKTNIDLSGFHNNVELQVIDHNGNCLLEVCLEPDNNSIKLDTETLSPGFYVIKCRSNKSLVTKKMIKL